jgi:hypothetical protein
MAETAPPRDAIEAFVQAQIQRGKDVRYPSRLVEHIATHRDQWFEVYTWMSQVRWGQGDIPVILKAIEDGFWTMETRRQWEEAVTHMRVCSVLDPADFEDVRGFLAEYVEHVAVCTAGRGE